MHDEVILTKEEYKELIVAKEKLNLLESIIGNCVCFTVGYEDPKFNDYEFMRAMGIIGYSQFDGINKIVRQKRIEHAIEQEKENENE